MKNQIKKVFGGNQIFTKFYLHMALHNLFLHDDMRSCEAKDTWHIHRGMSKWHITAWKNVWHWDTWHTLHYWLHQYTMTFVIMFSHNLSTFFIAILTLPSTTILFAILMFFAEIIAICKKFKVFTAEIPKLFYQIEKVSKNIYFSIE